MNTLMALWLLTGDVIELRTSAEACTAAVEALETGGIVMVELPSRLPVPATRAQCSCPYDPGEAL